jgi:FkbM family methyltransferase
VHAIEPVPVVYKCLKENLCKYDNVSVYNIGISDSEGSFKFSFDPVNSEMGMLNPAGNIDVNIQRLDDFLYAKNLPYVSFLKVDTETFEKHVLLGGKATLSRTKYLLIEVNFESTNNNYTVSELMSLLVSPQYNFQLLSIVNFLDKDISKAKILDLLFVNTRYVSKT